MRGQRERRDREKENGMRKNPLQKSRRQREHRELCSPLLTSMEGHGEQWSR